MKRKQKNKYTSYIVVEIIYFKLEKMRTFNIKLILTDKYLNNVMGRKELVKGNK